MATQFTSTLSLGSYGPEVRALQKFLNDNGYQVAAPGQPGSPGMETENFGNATLAALQRFQAANGIVSSGDPQSTGYGNFGPKTMAAVNQKIATSTPATVNTDGTISNPSNPSNPGNPINQNNPGNPVNDYTIQPAHIVNDAGGSAYFANGNDALVTLSGEGYGPQQMFFVDQTNKQLIPFSSMQSAVNYFSTVAGRQVTPQEINASLTQVPASVLGPNGGLAGFIPVQSVNGFDDEGRLINPAPSNANIQERYGRNVDQSAEMRAYSALDGFSKLLKDAGVGSTVTPEQITKLISDPTTMGYYINALAYGGYTLQDIYQDMVRRQAIDTGQGGKVLNSFPISTSMEATAYKATPNYKSVLANPTLNVNPSIEGIDESMLNNPVLSLPDSAFNTISPLSNPNSPEFREQMEQYKDATYQIALAMSQSANETEHSKALADWNSLKEEIESRLGITLSNNAVQAWNQIDSFTTQAGMANLGGSGMVDQKIDEYLRQQSNVNKSMRSMSSSDEEKSKESYYQNYASPDEIKALIASDPERAKNYGLIPTDAAKEYLTLSNLKAKFPGTPESDLQALINKHLDPNGNNYSKLYANYAVNQYEITGNQNVSAATALMQDQQNKATEALRQFSDPNNPFLKPGANPIVPPTLPSTNSAATPLSGDALKALDRAAQNLSQPSSPAPTPSPAPAPQQQQPQQTQTQAPASSSNPFGLTPDQLKIYNDAMKLAPTAAPKPATPAPAPAPKPTAPVGVLAPTTAPTQPKPAAQPAPTSLIQNFGSTLKNMFKF